MSANRPNGDVGAVAAGMRWSQSDVMAAWAETFGRPCSASMARMWQVAEWPLTVIADLGSIIDEAFRGDTGLARGASDYAAQFAGAMPRPLRHGYARTVAANRLNEVARVFWLEGVIDWREMSAWLTVIAGDPDEVAWEQATTFAIGGPDGLVAPGYGVGDLAHWREALPGAVAALAWAAGLTLPEARTRAEADSLDPGGLLALAGLRGYRLRSTTGAWA